MQHWTNLTPDIHWSFRARQRTVALMEGLFLTDKPDPNKKLREVPHKPGVYLMKDRLKRVIYVGKARDLRKRRNVPARSRQIAARGGDVD